MRTKTTLARAAAVLALVGSTLGARVPAAAAYPLPFDPSPSAGSTPEGLNRAEYRAPDESIAAELARQYEVELAAWYAWELAEWLRVEAENAAAAAARAAAARNTARPPRISSDEILQIIWAAAERHGIDPARFARIAGCESGGNPSAQNRSSGAAGLFQQLPQYWPGRAAAAGLPGADVFDPWANAEVSAYLYEVGGSGHWNASRSCWA